MANNIVEPIALLTFAAACFSLCWLFVDSLMLRIEMKTMLKALGFAGLGIGSTLTFFDQSIPTSFLHVLIWLTSISFFAIFLAFIADPQSKFQLGIIIAIVALPFLKDHDFLTLQAILIALSMLQLAYTTKHRDIIPLGIGFALIAIAEFFYSLKTKEGFEGMETAGAFLYLFSAVALFSWVWSYLKIRFIDVSKRSPFSNSQRRNLRIEDDDEENIY
ncbi:MAG: hypothetical protein A3D74_02240 [Candidatus Levybacteria bacterium RIFCSPHIGHO2_02_FULL_37_13]|nr:MAG: hypothetical protein A3D74_02240 [Candidatus Levybacteria bacterium RIFCSPHIGHO2_02_FULL_37_13]OGH29915.1 MAG: hypothetical protein A3E40_03405 [Candidatus Levybacteria bacterium RIFCSPHIGHO2_12_FULL_37_9]OGH39619.1 MAG: hypothetical protein A3B41_04160 [Candidatus Levybacteria bacterium RIFCSPLOWO2_01_FULL_37_26]